MAFCKPAGLNALSRLHQLYPRIKTVPIPDWEVGKHGVNQTQMAGSLQEAKIQFQII